MTSIACVDSAARRTARGSHGPGESLPWLMVACDGMRAPIDGAGRIVIPKPLRDALGLKGGMELELEAVDGHLEAHIPSATFRLEEGPNGPRFVSDDPTPPLTSETIRDVLDAVRDRRL